MTEAEIRASIADVLHHIAPESRVNEVDPEDDLREALDIDSFDYLNFLIRLHERLGVEIPENDYGKVRSLNGLVRYLGSRSKGRVV